MDLNHVSDPQITNSSLPLADRGSLLGEGRVALGAQPGHALREVVASAQSVVAAGDGRITLVHYLLPLIGEDVDFAAVGRVAIGNRLVALCDCSIPLSYRHF